MLTRLAAVCVLIFGALPAANPLATAAENPYERGPAPTTASIEAPTGAFAIKQATVPAGNGFGGGTLYFPTDTSQGTFGAVAISPGFMSPEGYIAWYGPRLASQGFVVITIATNTLADFPAQRGDQLLAALKYVVEKSEAKTRVDGSRLAVMGHSMGGGGSLEATLKHPAMQAVIPLTGWDMNTNFSALRTPALIIGAQADFIAPVGAHSRPFYQSLPATLDRAYLELAGASHFAPNTPNVTIAKYSISWLKRFVDNDTRYEQFLCPIPREPKASAFEGKCPHS